MKRKFGELLFLKDELVPRLTERYSVTINQDAASLIVRTKDGDIFSGCIIRRIVEFCTKHELDFYFWIEKGCFVIY